ncbi:hypothetical protein Tco_1541065 [Tanacetum coccineum]
MAVNVRMFVFGVYYTGSVFVLGVFKMHSAFVFRAKEKWKGKGAEHSKLVEKRDTGSSLLDTYAEKGTKAKERDIVAAKGKRKSDMIGDDKEKYFKVDGIPSKIGFYVVDNFNQDKMEIKLKERSIVITQQSIDKMLGLRNEGVDIMAEENAKDDEMVKD